VPGRARRRLPAARCWLAASGSRGERRNDVDIEPAGDHSQITFLSADVAPLPASPAEGSGSIDTGTLRLDFRQ